MSSVVWKAIILLGWPTLVAADYLMTTRILTMGGIELNPIARLALQFGTPYFLGLKVVHLLVVIALAMTLNPILQKINLMFGWAPRADIILVIWTLGFLMPAVWNSYWLYIWRP